MMIELDFEPFQFFTLLPVVHDETLSLRRL